MAKRGVGQDGEALAGVECSGRHCDGCFGLVLVVTVKSILSKLVLFGLLGLRAGLEDWRGGGGGGGGGDIIDSPSEVRQGIPNLESCLETFVSTGQCD